MKRWKGILAGMLGAGGMLASCSNPIVQGPPEIRPGRSECSACGMLISEERCSAAVLIEDEGERLYRLYDDIGCMLDDEHESGRGARVVERFVHDYNRGDWIAAERAFFLEGGSPPVQTPMGSGIVAFVDAEAAKACNRDRNGGVCDFAGVANARRNWMQSRHGVAATETDGGAK